MATQKQKSVEIQRTLVGVINPGHHLSANFIYPGAFVGQDEEVMPRSSTMECYLVMALSLVEVEA